jgi:hypothetical protein
MIEKKASSIIGNIVFIVVAVACLVAYSRIAQSLSDSTVFVASSILIPLLLGITGSLLLRGTHWTRILWVNLIPLIAALNPVGSSIINNNWPESIAFQLVYTGYWMLTGTVVFLLSTFITKKLLGKTP